MSSMLGYATKEAGRLTGDLWVQAINRKEIYEFVFHCVHIHGLIGLSLFVDNMGGHAQAFQFNDAKSGRRH